MHPARIETPIIIIALDDVCTDRNHTIARLSDYELFADAVSIKDTLNSSADHSDHMPRQQGLCHANRAYCLAGACEATMHSFRHMFRDAT